MKIYACVDPIGTSRQTPEEEYAEIKETLCDLLQCDPVKLDFRTDMYPQALTNQKVDIYVIDYGGMLPGAEDTIRSHFRELLRQIEDHPNTLFLIWSTFSTRWYAEIIEEDAPSDFKAPNVIFWMEDDAYDAVRVWFSIPEPPPRPRLKKPDDGFATKG